MEGGGAWDTVLVPEKFASGAPTPLQFPDLP